MKGKYAKNENGGREKRIRKNERGTRKKMANILGKGGRGRRR
jgi:hypothetical protein